MHNLAGGLVLGYHGCDRAIGERVLAGEAFAASMNPWDWLGHGVYFWEANPKRALDFAQELKSKRYRHTVIENPFVVGAVLNLGLCFDFTTSVGAQALKEGYSQIAELYTRAGEALPKNSKDQLRRNLDCRVIEHVIAGRAENGLALPDTVRGVFTEGGPIYPGSGFLEKTHIQISVRNPGCIKGVFRAPDSAFE